VSRPGYLACPVCGAPRTPGVARCDYCGSWLAIFVDVDDAAVEETVIREHISTFRNVLDARPDDVVALHGLGVALRSLGLVDDAIRSLARAANRRPESLAIQCALAGTLLDAVRDRPDDARMWRDVRRQADRVLALDPDAVDGWRLRAEVVLRTGDDAALIALVPDLARYDPDGDHRRIARRLKSAGDRWFLDWRWPEAVDAWAALAVLDPAAGRGALAGFLTENARLVPRSERRVWRAVRQTMASSGGLRMSTLAALALGLATAVALALLTFWLDRDLVLIVTALGVLILPVLSAIAVRTWLTGWPPYPVPRRPWAAVGTGDLVRVARMIAPDIERIQPTASP
jgi:tetratricopeptide (TPR) repeat protein